MKKLKPLWLLKQPATRLYHITVPIIGLTGGVASGKSSVSKLLRQNGIIIIDADYLVKEVYKKPEVLHAIEAIAPSAFDQHVLDFKKLRAIFFSDTEIQAAIEKIIYAQMPAAFNEAYLLEIKEKQDFIVYDVPLLFEKNLAPFVDIKVCVWCSPEEQIRRVIKRDNIDEELAKKMLSRQLDINKKKEMSDIIIDNSKDLTALEGTVKKFIADLLVD